MLVTWKESDWWFTESNKHFTCKKSTNTSKENLERILTSLAWNQARLRSSKKKKRRAKQVEQWPFSSSDRRSARFERRFFRLFPPVWSLVPGYNKSINTF